MTGNRLRVTDSAANQAGSAYFPAQQDISQGFDTAFDFQLTNGTQPPADGFTFVLQSSGPTAIGQGGGGLGYQSMPGTSAAVKFDVYVPTPAGATGFPQTGLYTNGQMDDNGVPVSPRLGINFADGSVYRVELQYYPVPKLLTETIQNTLKPGIGFSHTYTGADLIGTLGTSQAYVGFTGGTGALDIRQEILDWSYNTTPRTGAEAHYFPQAFWAGQPVNGTVPTVDFSYPGGDFGVGGIRPFDNSIIFTGVVHVDQAGTYSFVSNTDDDGYLYVGGHLASSDPGSHAQEDAPNVFPLQLVAGDYDFVLLESNGSGDAGAHLEWVTPAMAANQNFTPVVVPTDHLAPLTETPTPPSNLVVLKEDGANPTSNRVDLGFADNSPSETNVQLQRSADSGKTWQTVAQAGINATTIQDAQPLPGTTYQYRVVAVNFDGVSAPSNVITVAIPAIPPANFVVGTDPLGVEAHYFNGELVSQGDGQDPANFINNGAVGPIEFRTFFSVDFAYGFNSPDMSLRPDIPRVHPDSFTTVWTGKVVTGAAGVYTFISNTDDDGYLYVNGQLVSSDPGGHGAENAPNLTPMTLQANTAYNFVLLQNEGGGTSDVHLLWVPPGQQTPTVIPYYMPPQPGVAAQGGLVQVSDVPHHQTVDASGVVTDIPQDSAVTGLKVGLFAGVGVALAWTNQNTSALWYEIQRSTDGGNSWSSVGRVGFNTRSFVDGSVKDTSKSYLYRVRGVNWDGAGPFTDPTVASVYWTGRGDGVNWTDPKNWSIQALPRPTDSVIINIVGNADTVVPTVHISDGLQSIQSLFTTDPLVVDGGTLAVAQTVNFTNTFNVTSGGLTGGTYVAGKSTSLSVSNATLDGVSFATNVTAAGLVTVKDGMTLLGGSVVNVQGLLANLSLPGTLEFAGSQSLGGAGTVEFEGNNADRIQVDQGSALTIASGITIGTDGSGGSLTGDTVVNNGALKSLSEGQLLTISTANFANLGSIAPAFGSTIAVSNVGNFTQAGGSATINGGFTATSLTIAGGTFTYGNASAPAAVRILTVTGGTLAGAGDVAVSGQLNLTGGEIDGPGKISLASGGIGAWAGPITLSREIDSAGTITFAAGAVSATAGASFTVNTLAGGTFNTSGVVSFTGGVFISAGTVNIAPGTLNLFGGGTLSGNLVLQPKGNLNPAAGTLFNGLTLSGALTLLNTHVTVVNGLTLVKGSSITLTSAKQQTCSLDFNGVQTLGGSGQIILTDPTFTSLGVGTGKASIIPALTVASGITIQGDGIVTGVPGAALINQGTINANVSTQPLLVSVPNFTNQGGTAEATNGGILNLTTTSTTISGGTTTLSGVTSLSNVAVTGGSLTLNGTTTTTIQNLNLSGGTISGTAPITLAGTVNVTGGSFTTTGVTTVTQGSTVAVNVPTTFVIPSEFDNAGTVAIAAGALELDGAGNQTGAFTVAPTASLVFGGTSLQTFAAGSSLTGGGAVSFTGGVRANLLGAYRMGATTIGGTSLIRFLAFSSTDTLTVNGGTLVVGGTAAPTQPALKVATPALGTDALQVITKTILTGGETVVMPAWTLQVGSVGLIITGAGSPIVTLDSDNTTPGILSMTGNLTFNATGSATFRNMGTGTLSGVVDLGAAARLMTITHGSSPIDIAVSAQITGSGSIGASGSGMLQLSAPSTFTGGVTLSGPGTVEIDDAAALGTGPVTFSGGVLAPRVAGGTLANALTVASSGTIALDVGSTAFQVGGFAAGAALSVAGTTGGGLTVGGDVALRAPLAIHNSVPLAINGIVSGAQPITKDMAGSLTLGGSSPNTYAGLTQVAGGSLVLNKTTGPAVPGDLRLDGPVSASMQHDGQLAGSSGVTFDSTGGQPTLDLGGHALTVGSVNSFQAGAGVITLGAGTLTVGAGTYSGTVAGTGTFLKQGAGALTLGNAHTFSGSALSITGGPVSISPPSASNTVSSLSISGGSLDLAGSTLTVAYGANPTPAASIRSLLASAKLKTTVGSALGFGDSADGTVSGLAANSIVVKPARRGDVNLDGKVNFSDLLLLAQNYNHGSNWDKGDFTYDGAVNFADLLLLAQNYGATTASPALAVTQPATRRRLTLTARGR